LRPAVLLVAHGSPPKDVPREMLDRLRRLRVLGGEEEELRRLEEAIRKWPRSRENDPHWWSTERIARMLSERLGLDVHTAYLEFCSPTVEEKLGELLRKHGLVVVVPTMVVEGGRHVEVDIRREIESALARVGRGRVVYAFPFRMEDFVELLARQVLRFLGGLGEGPEGAKG